ATPRRHADRQTIVLSSVAERHVEMKIWKTILRVEASLPQRLSSHRPLRRVPWRRLPSGSGRARRRVLHPGRVERRAPAPVVVLSQLQSVALRVDPDGDVAWPRAAGFGEASQGLLPAPRWRS